MRNDGYPDDWHQIALRAKHKAGWKCERCRHPHDPQNGYTLTVHHLDHDKTNSADWNLPALCQRCHLHLEHKTLRQVHHLTIQAAIFDVNEDWLNPRLKDIEKALGKHKE